MVGMTSAKDVIIHVMKGAHLTEQQEMLMIHFQLMAKVEYVCVVPTDTHVKQTRPQWSAICVQTRFEIVHRVPQLRENVKPVSVVTRRRLIQRVCHVLKLYHRRI